MEANKCPLCGSTDTHGDDGDGEEGIVREYMHCDACGADYVNTYTLSEQAAYQKHDERDAREIRVDELADTFKDLIDAEDDRLADAWNVVARAQGWKVIHRIEDIRDAFDGNDPLLALRYLATSVRFSVLDKYYWESAGELASVSLLSQTPIRASVLAEYAADHDEDFGIPEIRDALQRTRNIA